jgi:hypothetical protein
MLELAVTNNIAWYSAIFRAHGLPNRLEEHYWVSETPPPPYYSNLVTRTRGEAARVAQLKRLSELSTPTSGQSFGFKDAFDELPQAALESLGFWLLFRATWYGWAAADAHSEAETPLIALRVENERNLFDWEESWRESSPAGKPRVFPESVLSDRNLELFTMELDGRTAGGFALNHSDGALGLSNVFRLENVALDDGVFIRECARHARRLHADRPIVGYGSEAALRDLRALGFVPLGPLAVWVSR